MALRWKAFAPNTILRSVEVQDLADNGVVQLDTAADLASADLVNANMAFVLSENNIYKRNAAGVGADKWGGGGGKILQIVRATDSTQRDTTSTNFVDVTGMSVTISPKQTSSALIILSTFRIGASAGHTPVRLTDSSNNPLPGAEFVSFGETTTSDHNSYLSLFAYVTPATTSAVTYKLQFSASIGMASIFNNQATGQMFAIEVGA